MPVLHSRRLLESANIGLLALFLFLDILSQHTSVADPKIYGGGTIHSDKTPVLESGSIEVADSTDKMSAKSHEKMLQGYKELFALKRKQQISTAETLVNKDGYSKQYKLTKVLVDEIFKTLRNAQNNLTNVNSTELSEFPVENKTVLDSLINVWENTAFLGDMLLRLPDICHRMIDGHKVRMAVVQWSIAQCFKSPVYSKILQKHLELMQQEMKTADELDPNYENPFAASTIERKQVYICRIECSH